jgi:hypothetical protein
MIAGTSTISKLDQLTDYGSNTPVHYQGEREAGSMEGFEWM